MIVGGKRGVFIFEASLELLDDPMLGTTEVSVVRVSRESYLD